MDLKIPFGILLASVKKLFVPSVYPSLYELVKLAPGIEYDTALFNSSLSLRLSKVS
jgi:hypothetical protein